MATRKKKLAPVVAYPIAEPRFRTDGTVYRSMAEEPLLAVAEGEDTLVVGCGPHGCGVNQHKVEKCSRPLPTSLRLERVTRQPSGSFTVEETHDVALGSGLLDACKDGSCLPWLRATRDPEKFRKAYRFAQQIGPMTDSKCVWSLLQNHFIGEDQETFVVVLLDTQLRVRGVGEIARGARDHVEVPTPDVLRLPILNGATGFVVIHNHPSGKPAPSSADCELTKTLVEAGELMGIPLVDHLIFGASDYYSFLDDRKINRGKK